MSLCHYVTMSLCHHTHYVTMSLCHYVTVWPPPLQRPRAEPADREAHGRHRTPRQPGVPVSPLGVPGTPLECTWAWEPPGVYLAHPWRVPGPGSRLGCTWHTPGVHLGLGAAWGVPGSRPGVYLAHPWRVPGPGSRLGCTWHTPGVHLGLLFMALRETLLFPSCQHSDYSIEIIMFCLHPVSLQGHRREPAERGHSQRILPQTPPQLRVSTRLLTVAVTVSMSSTLCHNIPFFANPSSTTCEYNLTHCCCHCHCKD